MRIKVRLNPYKHYCNVESYEHFVHVFGNIMEGRSEEQKQELSHAVVSALKSAFPELPVISMNIIDFEKATYCNQSMV